MQYFLFYKGSSFKLDLRQPPSPVWQDIAAYDPTMAHRVQLATFNELIYLIGAQKYSPFYLTIQEYDPLGDKYTQVAIIPVAHVNG